MAWTFCTSGAAINKAGIDANSTIVASGSALEAWSNEAENSICMIVDANVIGQYASLTANGKETLQRYCSAYIAQKIVAYDTGGYFQRSAETILDLCETDVREVKDFLNNEDSLTFLGITR